MNETVNYKAIKLGYAPGEGKNPPTGAIFEWLTETDGVLTIHWRDSNGDDHTFISGVADPSSDGKTYGRKNGAWAEIVASGGGGLTATEVTENTTIANGKLYIANSASNLDFTLPATFAQGFTFGIFAKGAGGWTILSGAGSQSIKTLGSSSAVSVVAGARIQTQSAQYGYCEYVASTADTTLFIVSDKSSDYFPSDKGYNSGGYTTVDVNTIDALIFAGESNNAISATLTAVRSFAAGYNSTVKGYTYGGSGGSTINALTFTTEANVVVSGQTANLYMDKCGFNSTAKGYVAGGTTRTYIDALVFATDVNSRLTAALAANKGFAAGYNSDIKGYVAGGYNGSVNLKTIESFLFSNETVAAVTAQLAAIKREQSSYNSSTKGYSAGGRDAGGGLNVIEALLFADESCSTIAATLAGIVTFGGGVNSGTKGYSNTTAGAIESLVFADESCSTISATMSSNRSKCAGFQSGGFV